MSTQTLNTPSLPTLPGLDLQLEGIRNRFTQAHSSKGEERLTELKAATQEFEAVFVNYMLKVMRSTIEPADEETSSLGKDVYMGMFDNEISLDIARNNSMGIGDLLYRQLEGTVREGKEKQSPRTRPPSSSQDGKIEAEAWSNPVEGALTSSYGFRNDPFSGDVRFHHGLDISAPAGTAIRAAQAGRVVFSGYLGGFGNTIILEHVNGYRTLYGHTARNLVNSGELVEAEQEIGIVGNTGRSKGTHLHFELQKGSQGINPLEFLTVAKLPASN